MRLRPGQKQTVPRRSRVQPGSGPSWTPAFAGVRLALRCGLHQMLLPVDVLERAVLEQPLAVLLHADVVIDAAVALGDAVLVVDFTGIAEDDGAIAVDLDRSRPGFEHDARIMLH